MTLLGQSRPMSPPSPPAAVHAIQHVRLRRWERRDAIDGLGAGVSSFCFTWLLYERLLPLSGGLGFFVMWYGVFLVTYWLLVRDRHGRMAARDRFAAAVVTSVGALLVGSLLLILGYVGFRGYRALRPAFFTQDQRFTTPLGKATEGGGSHAIIGTLEQVGLATLISVPLGIMTAVFLTEIGGPLAKPVRLITDAMSAIPSIVAGLFVYALLILSLHLPQSGFAAALALSVLMLATVTRTCEVVLRLVPGGLREASLALGGTEWRTVRSVVLPTVRAGLVTAVILGIARVVGETAPLLLTAGGNFVVNANPFRGRQDSLPLFVFRLIRFPQAAEQQRAWTGALVLIALVLLLFIIARVIGGHGPGHIGRIRRRRLRRKGLL
jgi:phosphate transport system permease protein